MLDMVTKEIVSRCSFPKNHLMCNLKVMNKKKSLSQIPKTLFKKTSKTKRTRKMKMKTNDYFILV